MREVDEGLLRRATCIACGRQVNPATMEGFEAHSLVCKNGEECWRIAARTNAVEPDALVDEVIELRGGLTAVVVAVKHQRLRRALQLPPQHILQFDSGRTDVVALDDGTSGQPFRIISDAEEAAEIRALNNQRLQAELEAAKDYVKDLDQIKRQLEESTLCAICLDHPKDTAFVPCGHRVCESCACRVMLDGGPALCPICRHTVRSTLRVYN